MHVSINHKIIYKILNIIKLCFRVQSLTNIQINGPTTAYVLRCYGNSH